MIKLADVSKFYHDNNVVAQGMRKVSLDFALGEFVVITGESGSGKSTLLNVISGVDTYEDGEMYVDDIPTSGFDERDWDHYRRNYIGFIFQNYNLIESYTVYENVESALVLTDVGYKERRRRVNAIIDRVGLSKWRHQRTAKLSGGQKQRVAIARALAKDTPVIVADEPTGNLDAESGRQIAALLGEISHNKLVIVVSHNYPQFAEFATRKVKMRDGEVVEDLKLKDPKIIGDSAAPLTEPVHKRRWAHSLFFAWHNFFRQPKRSIFIFIVALISTIFVAMDIGNAMVESYQYASFFNGFIYNNPYPNDDPSRIVVTRLDGAEWTEADSARISRIPNVKNVTEDDPLVDTNYPTSDSLESRLNFADDPFIREYYSGIPLLAGRAPMAENEVVLTYGYSYYVPASSLPYTINFATNSVYHDIYPSVTVVGYTKNDGKTNPSMFFRQNDLTNLTLPIQISQVKSQMSLSVSIQYDDEEPTTYSSEINNLVVDSSMSGTDTAKIYVVSSGYTENYSIYMNGETTALNVQVVYTTNYSLVDTVAVSPDFLAYYATGSNQVSVFVGDMMFRNFVLSRLNHLGYRTVIPANYGQSNLGVIKILVYLVVFIRNGFLLLLIGIGTYIVMRSMLRAKLRDYAILSTIGLDKKEIKILSLLELWLAYSFAFIVTMVAFSVLRFAHTNLFAVLISNLNAILIITIYLLLLGLSYYIIHRFTRYMKKKSLLSEIKGIN